MTTAAASLAALAGLAAWADAKYHVSQDVAALRFKKAAEKHYAELVRTKRQSLWYAFAPHVPLYASTLCIWSRDKSYTWQETHDGAVRWARFFLAQGVRPGDMVGTYLANSADFPVIWLGLLCIGCAPAMLNYNLKGESLVHCLRVAGVKVVLVGGEEEVKGRFEECRGKVEEMGVTAFTVDEALLEKVGQNSTDVPGDEYREGVTGKDPVCLLYTSGTTGLPKAGKFMTNRYHERSHPDKLPFGQKAGPGGDRWYCCMPLFHGTGGLAVMAALTSGISVAVGKKFSTSGFWDDIHDSDASMFVYVGEAARYLLMAPTHPRERDHRLRGMYGNGMRPDVWTRFQERFNVPEVIEFFNSTEGVLGMFVHSKGPFTATSVGHHGAIIRRALHDVYVPVSIDAETGALVRDPATGFVRRNTYTEGGEILVQVPSEDAFAGYHNNASATAKKFERNVFRPGDLYYRSGDALRRDDDGRWFFLDRLGDTYRWKSENVSTAEVAEVLGRFPRVAEAIVYGVLVPKHDGRAGCVALRLGDGADAGSVDFAGLLAHAREKLPKYAVPVFVRLIRAASNTDNQKQNKGPLRLEGIEVERFGEKVVGGAGDEVFWAKPGAAAYVRFTQADLEALREGRVTL